MPPLSLNGLRPRCIGAGLSFLLLAACAGANAADEWTGTVETLPNGVVRVSNPPKGMWPEGRGWRLEPELALGDEDGPEPFIFASISGVEADAQGRIYVLDRESNTLKIFSPAGEHVRTVGREGGGPGEYRQANGLRWLSPDTLLVVDQRGERYSILDKEGGFVRSVNRQLQFYGWMFSGDVVGDRVYEHAFVGHGTPELRPALQGIPLRATDTLAARDTVSLPPPPGNPEDRTFVVRTKQGGMTMSVPFAPGSVAVLDPTGHLWLGHGDAFRLVQTTLAGDTTREVILDATPTPVSDQELAEWEQGESVKEFRERGGHIDMARIPRVKPFFEGVYPDPQGNLWVSIPAGPLETVFAVFDSGGRYLGRVQTAGFRRNRYIPPAARNGRLYLAGQDSLDVPKVYTFRVVK